MKLEKTRVSANHYFNAIKAVGGTAKCLSRYSQWVEVMRGAGSVKANFDLYELELYGTKSWILVDAFRRVATVQILDKQEVLNWLKEHGWNQEAEDEDEEDEEE